VMEWSDSVVVRGDSRFGSYPLHCRVSMAIGNPLTHTCVTKQYNFVLVKGGAALRLGR